MEGPKKHEEIINRFSEIFPGQEKLFKDAWKLFEPTFIEKFVGSVQPKENKVLTEEEQKAVGEKAKKELKNRILEQAKTDHKDNKLFQKLQEGPHLDSTIDMMANAAKKRYILQTYHDKLKSFVEAHPEVKEVKHVTDIMSEIIRHTILKEAPKEITDARREIENLPKPIRALYGKIQDALECDGQSLAIFVGRALLPMLKEKSEDKEEYLGKLTSVTDYITELHDESEAQYKDIVDTIDSLIASEE